MQKYKCNTCGWIYDPKVGVPKKGIAPGVDFKDLPGDFKCPKCGAGKDKFSLT
jgi:rubredoxin